MKLTHIRLAGFKSFAEPTVIVTPGQRIAVVGPNGCGKSNLIDAVRWVLGESRASNLRGEAMQDVIFSGTAQRRAIGRASVELMFEQDGEGNSPWSVYRELSVKRVMTREGESTYFINNQPVRRKDITDLFLGSGLGARSFAIIEQGMISKVIEAKPEEMRTLVEDAAGIARYRERRKESESRLQSAREQLLRLGDVRGEWFAQYEKLEVQAKQARRYVDLQGLKTKHEAALLVCKSEQEALKLSEAESALIELETQKDKIQQQCEASQQSAQQARENYDAVQLQLRAAQQEQAHAQVEHARLQSSMREIQQQRASLEEERERLETQQQQWVSEWQIHVDALPALEVHLQSVNELLEQANELESELREALMLADSAFHIQQKEWSEHQQHLTQVEQQRQTLKVRDEHIQKRLTQLGADEERTRQSLAAVPEVDADARSVLAEREQTAAENLEAARIELETAETALKDQKAEEEITRGAFEATRAHVQSLRARYEAVRVLEQEKITADWSEEWVDHPPFWAFLSVESGWERAVEVALRERFHARQGVFDSEAPIHWGGVLWSVLPVDNVASVLPSLPKGMKRLRDVVKVLSDEVKAAFDVWCSGVVIAEDVAEALKWQQEGKLQGLQVVTREGAWVDAISIQSFIRPDDHCVALALKSQREALEVELTQSEVQLEQAESAFKKAKQDLDFAEMALKAARQQAAYCQDQWHQLNTDRRVLEERTQRNEQQVMELTQHRRHIVQQREHEEQDQLEFRMQAQEAEIQHEELMKEREKIRAARNESDVAVSKARTALTDAQQRSRQYQQDHIRSEAALKQWEERKGWLTQQNENWKAQEAALKERVAQCEAKSVESIQASLEDANNGVEAALQKLADLESSLQTAQAAWKEADEARMRADRRFQDIQTRREALVLAVERARLEWAHTQNAVLSSGLEKDQLSDLVQQGSEVLQASITGFEKAIATLGPVNLVALDEVEGAKSRLDELESQHSDVQEAVLTLEEAIRRLDVESRQRLRHALEALNRALATHFAAMFGGGSAQLVPTGTDLLSAGIQLWAEPPGKRNVSLHLLSGGEKALTAISLMLALFDLNPAPFCLLDEVDAPLDDVNTARLAKMLIQLSGRVQCVYISHHRLTMEVAEQLVGVTMPEAGVSRVVEVDLQSALAWAGSQKKKGVEAHG